MARIAEEERVAKAKQWAADYEVARSKLQALARQRFWTDRGVPETLAAQFADALPLTSEQLAREVEQFDVNLAVERLQMMDVARRLYRERGLLFPVIT